MINIVAAALMAVFDLANFGGCYFDSFQRGNRYSPQGDGDSQPLVSLVVDGINCAYGEPLDCPPALDGIAPFVINFDLQGWNKVQSIDQFSATNKNSSYRYPVGSHFRVNGIMTASPREQIMGNSSVGLPWGGLPFDFLPPVFNDYFSARKYVECGSMPPVSQD